MANTHTIDWRIYGEESQLEDLLEEIVGFGEDTTGGAGGTVYHVTNLNDSGAGSLRAAAESATTYWIVFDVSGTITQATVMNPLSNKTIDGRGADITISGAGIEIGTWQTSSGPIDNIIIHNIKFEDITSNGAVIIAEEASNVWIDHCTFHDATDELIYIGSGSSVPPTGTRPAPYGITVSWCKFPTTTPDQGFGDKSILISDPGDWIDFIDKNITLTLHHNHYQTYVRHPLARWAKIHAFNNYLDRTITGAQAGTKVRHYSENDIYEKHPSGVTLMLDADITGGGYDALPLNVKCIGEYLLNGATVEELNPETIFDPATYYTYTASTADATLLAAVEAGSGWQDVELP